MTNPDSSGFFFEIGVNVGKFDGMDTTYYDMLNEGQKEACDPSGNILAIACPGSGKTRMLATKASMLLSNEDNLVMCTTFSKGGALELKERILHMCRPEHVKRLYVGTLDALAYRLLDKKDRQLVHGGERKNYMLEVLKNVGSDVALKDGLKLIDDYKTRGELPDKASVEGAIFFGYQEKLKRNQQIDFGDMIPLALDAIKRKRVGVYQMTHLLVDEFQDTSLMQYRFLCEHRHAAITVVGDDDQSIYAFRNAMGYRGMEMFSNDFSARRVVLGDNYRSQAEILTKADILIKNNPSRIAKTLRAFKGPGGVVEKVFFGNAELEAEAIADKISAWGKGNYAVLARNNRLLDMIELMLRIKGIEYYRENNDSLFDHAEVAMFFGLIESVSKLRADVGIDSVFAFIELAVEDREALFRLKLVDFELVSKARLVESGVSDEGVVVYRNFATNFKEWRGLFERGLYSLMINGVADWLIERISKKKAHSIKMVGYAALVLDKLSGPIASRIRFLRDKKPAEKSDDVVVLETLHGSKGKEFDHVFIIRAEDSICPSEDSPLEEERRIFYVGVTRARKYLHISMTPENPTSVFIREMFD